MSDQHPALSDKVAEHFFNFLESSPNTKEIFKEAYLGNDQKKESISALLSSEAGKIFLKRITLPALSQISSFPTLMAEGLKGRVYCHGGLKDVKTLDQLNLFGTREDTKQGNKYCGFYLGKTPDHVERYAASSESKY